MMYPSLKYRWLIGEREFIAAKISATQIYGEWQVTELG